MIGEIIMDKKYILIVVAIVAIVAVIGGYFLFNNQSITMTEHNTIVLSNSSYMDVPVADNATLKADKKGIYYYKDNLDDLNITGCSNLSASSAGDEMSKLKNTIAVGSEKLNEDNAVIYVKDGIYSIFVKNTQYNDTLLMQSTNKNLLLQCLRTVKYHDPTEQPKFDNASSSSGSGKIVRADVKTQKAVQSSAPKATTSSSSSSSTSSSNWGYNFGSSSKSSSSGKSGGGGSISGGVKSSDVFDFD